MYGSHLWILSYASHDDNEHAFHVIHRTALQLGWPFQVDNNALCLTGTTYTNSSLGLLYAKQLISNVNHGRYSFTNVTGNSAH